jgi:fatty-acyl-CoA synthase
MKNLSYVKGEGGKPLFDLNMGQFFDSQTRKHADRPFLVSPLQSKGLNYSQLRELVLKAAASLLSLGVKPADRVGVWSTNRFEWVVLQFAVARIGAILVHINPAYREDELEYTIKHAGCRALFLSPNFRTHDCLASALRVKNRAESLQYIVSLDERTVTDVLDWNAFLNLSDGQSANDLVVLTQSISAHCPASIQYTSGTTGKPKGATLTHYNMLNNGNQVGDRLGLNDADVICLPVPMFHCFGSVVGVIAAMAYGACIVFTGEGFDAQQCIELIEQEKCTAFYGVPMMYIGILHASNFDERKMRSLQKGIMGASSCPSEVFKAAIEKMHLQGLSSSYGMTETSPISTQSNPNDTLEHRTQTVGFVHPHLEIKIIDPVTRDTLEKGQSGELCVRGYSVMQGYWQDSVATAQAIDDEGWMHSGDLAVMQGDGYVSIVGRIKDMVIRAGENIYPREIEEFLHKLPEVADVQVFGVPDPLFGEQLAAWVKLKPGCQLDSYSIHAKCKGLIASFKIPQYWKFVDEFPSTASGKVQKFKMREIMVKELNLKN